MESLDLTYDTLFKIYFKSKECFNYLISIISELLKIDKEYVRENLKILDSEIITENANKEKKKMTDCMVSIDNIIIVFEMNRNYYKKIKENKLKYLCAIFASKKYWDEEKNLILFNINAYKSKLDKPKKFSSYVLKNKSNDIYTQTIKVYEMYLEYENKKYKEGKRLKKLEKYLLYLFMTRYDKNEISMEHIEEAIDKVMAGPEKKSRIISDEEKENTAYHEVGHALLARLLKDCDPLHKVSIIPRGMALGITTVLPEKDHLTLKKSQLLDRITMILGGRVAEELIYGPDSITTGAQNDLEKVSALARKMVTVYGMSEKMGNLAYGTSQEHVFMGRDFGHQRDFSEEIAADIDKEVNKALGSVSKLARGGFINNLLGNDSDNVDLIDIDDLRSNSGYDSLDQPYDRKASDIRELHLKYSNYKNSSEPTSRTNKNIKPTYNVNLNIPKNKNYNHYVSVINKVLENYTNTIVNAL